MPDERSHRRGREMIGRGSLAAAAMAICLAACSPEPADAPAAVRAAENITTPAQDALTGPKAPSSPTAEAPPAAGNVLTLAGLGDLKIGQAVPASGSWRQRGAQVPGSCRTISSADFPGVYAIVEGGKVRRITIGQNSKVKLIEGIGTGATEAEVREAFPGFREEPHEYVESPAKYLTAPNAPTGGPALRFEMGREGKVNLIHVSTSPVLEYVEACA